VALSELAVSLGRRFARVATRAVVARPWSWRLLRAPLRKQFDSLAAAWEGRVGPEGLMPLGAALERLELPPTRVLDLGTGTGKAARVAAKLFPAAEIVGVDLSGQMIREARRLLPTELEKRVRYEVADASTLPFESGGFDLVLLMNMIPFFEELARVVAPDGTLVFAFTSGPETPIYVPTRTLQERLIPHGFERWEEIQAGPGTAVIARRAKRV
jgi:SAM-dependent methyltransferase